MNKYKTLLSNTLLISIGTFGSKLLVFLMVRFYTGYLTPADYSTADLITQTANLLFPVISFGITDGVFRFVLDNGSNRQSVFSSGFSVITLGSLLFLFILPVLSGVDDIGNFVWLVVAYTMAYCYHSLCAQYIRGVGKTALFAIQGIINTCLVIILNILFLAFFNMGITGYVLSVVLADTFCTAFLFIKEKLWREITLKIDAALLKAMLKYSIPLIPATIFWWITSVSDRYMVKAMIGSAANGLYTVSYKLPTVLTLISSIFMQAWQFSAITEDDGNKQEHAKFFGKVWGSFQAVMFIAGAVIIAFAKPAIRILCDSEYYTSWQYVPLLSVAMVFTAFTSFMGTVYIVNKKSGISFITAFIGAATNIVLNLLLIPSDLGVQGAAIATVFSYLLVFVIRCFNVRKYISFKLYSIRVILNSILIFLQSAAMIFEINGWIAVQVACLLAMIIINYKFFVEFIRKILKSFLGRKNNV